MVLYYYFVQRRLPTLFREYKQNLRRLGFPENAPQYTEKFNAVYSTATGGIEAAPLSSPILITTILSILGWILVFFPVEAGLNKALVPQLKPPPEMGLPPDRPLEGSNKDLLAQLVPTQLPLPYGFLGAYVFGLTALVHQYVTNDLQSRYYASLTKRYLIVFVQLIRTHECLAQVLLARGEL
jgi:hypothetical protein